MFWTCIRWGGTVLIIVLVLAALFLGGQQGPQDQAGQPDQPVKVQPAEPPPANKNFNL